MPDDSLEGVFQGKRHLGEGAGGGSTPHENPSNDLHEAQNRQKEA